MIYLEFKVRDQKLIRSLKALKGLRRAILSKREKHVSITKIFIEKINRSSIELRYINKSG